MSDHVDPETNAEQAAVLAAVRRIAVGVEPDVYPVEAQLQRIEKDLTDLESNLSALTMRLQPVLHEAYPEPGDEQVRAPLAEVPVVRTLAGYAEHVELLTARVRDVINRLAV